MSIKLAEGQIVELKGGEVHRVEPDGDYFVINRREYNLEGKCIGIMVLAPDVKRIIEDPNDPPAQQSLSRRDQFAMAAMQGFCNSFSGGRGDPEWFEQVACPAAARVADAMIAELDKDKA